MIRTVVGDVGGVRGYGRRLGAMEAVLAIVIAMVVA